MKRFLFLGVLLCCLFLSSVTSVYAYSVSSNGDDGFVTAEAYENTRLSENTDNVYFTIFSDYSNNVPVNVTLVLDYILKAEDYWAPDSHYANAMVQSTISALSINWSQTIYSYDGISSTSPGATFVTMQKNDLSGTANIPLSITPGTEYLLSLTASAVVEDNESTYSYAQMSYSFILPTESNPGNNNNPVPEPTTMLLLGSGLFGLAGSRKRFSKK